MIYASKNKLQLKEDISNFINSIKTQKNNSLLLLDLNEHFLNNPKNKLKTTKKDEKTELINDVLLIEKNMKFKIY